MNKVNQTIILSIISSSRIKQSIQQMEINIIMLNVANFPTQELPAGRSFFKKGQFFGNFYYLQEGKISVIINFISIEVSTPMFIGDFEILADLQYRTTMIKAITKCKIRVIPTHFYQKIDHHHQTLINSFENFHIKTKVLRYWLKKLFIVTLHNKNDVIKCENSIGIVLQGQFKHDSNIPIVKMKERNLQLLRKFEICVIGQQELFEESVICHSHRGMVGILEEKYALQLSTNFEEFSGILSVSNFKKNMHISMTKQIAKNCRKKNNLFQNMVPITLKDSIKVQQLTERHENHSLSSKKDRYQISKLMSSDEVFTVKDNITQFLHSQWRRGLSLKLPRKPRETIKLNDIRSFRKKKIEDFNNPQMINLSIPREFKEVKFNFKMLLKTKDTHLMKSRRMKTQPIEPTKKKLLFQD